MFSTVKRAWTSISPSELDACGDQYSPDSILLKEECLVKSCYSFFFLTSLPTRVSSPLGVSRTRDKWTMIHMQSVHSWVYFACLAEVTLHHRIHYPIHYPAHISTPCCGEDMIFFILFIFLFPWCETSSMIGAREGEEERCLHISDKWARCFH